MADKEEFVTLLDRLKDIPDYLQPMTLFMMCKANPYGGKQIEDVARILAGYGMPVDKVYPCILDLMKVIVSVPTEERGDCRHNITGEI